MAGQKSSSAFEEELEASSARCITEILATTSGGAQDRTKAAQRRAIWRVGQSKALDPGGPYFPASSSAKAWMLQWMKNLD